MKKNKSVRWTALLIIFTLLPACSDFLDIKPISDLTLEAYWKTEMDAKNGVVAVYSTFASAMSQGIWNWGEIRADNFTYYLKNATDQQELIENKIPIDNPLARWTTLYACISKANAALKYIPDITMNQELKNDYLAEVHAIRALCYFYCVRVWGDVPLYLEPIESIKDGIYRERTDKDYIIEKVILPDLESAYYNIDRTREEVDTKRTRMSMASVIAILMDVYAWIHDYEMVVKIFDERVMLLNANWRTLTAEGGKNFDVEWRKMFNETTGADRSPEVWFRVDYDRYGNGENSARSYFAASSSKLEVSSRLLKNVYEKNDRRANLQWITTDGGRKYRLRKKFWTDEEVQLFVDDQAVDSDVDLVMYRFADVVLLYAEALHGIGKMEDAINMLNKTRTRAGNTGYTLADFVSDEEILDAIIAERQKEFVGEGKRWFDLVRTNRWTQFTSLTDPDPQKALFPVYRDHLTQNPNLTQNYPAYPYP